MEKTGTRNLIGYVLVTHGKRYGEDRPGARLQVRNLEALARYVDCSAVIHSDYARSHRGLADLPALRNLLELMQDAKGRVVMDDLARLFRTMPEDKRGCFLEELLAKDGDIAGVRQGAKTLRQMTPPQRSILILGGPPGTFRYGDPPQSSLPEDLRQRQTVKATRVSQKARRLRSSRQARMIQQVQRELQETGAKATLKAIAAAANEQGLRTQRGTPWTPSSVHRMLKLALEDERGDG